MNYLRLLPLVCLFGFLPASDAADKPVKVKPSKVSAAKGRDREKLFTPWMTQNELAKLNDEKEKGSEQMIYFEYHEGKREYRAIHSKAIRFNGWWWNTTYGEKEMEDEVNTYKARGYAPLFVVLEGNYYRMLFVKPEQISEAQKILKELGVEPPALK